MPAAASPSSAAPARSDADARVACVASIVRALLRAYDARATISVPRLVQATSAAHGLARLPRLLDILSALPEERRAALAPFLRVKPVRTASGIAVVAVMCKPHRCPHTATTGSVCVYCLDERTEVLTERGFLSLAALLRARGAPALRFGAYDAARGAIVYQHASRLVVNAAAGGGGARMVRLEQRQEAAEAAGGARCRGVSLLVTPEHDMHVRRGRSRRRHDNVDDDDDDAAASDVVWEGGGSRADDAAQPADAPGWSKVRAEALLAPHAPDALRLRTAAPRGALGDAAAERRLRAALGGLERGATWRALLELYGFALLRGGSALCAAAAGGGDAGLVALDVSAGGGEEEEEEEDWLSTTLATLGLQSLPEAAAPPAAAARRVVALPQAWAAFFAAPAECRHGCWAPSVEGEEEEEEAQRASAAASGSPSDAPPLWLRCRTPPCAAADDAPASRCCTAACPPPASAAAAAAAAAAPHFAHWVWPLGRAAARAILAGLVRGSRRFLAAAGSAAAAAVIHAATADFRDDATRLVLHAGRAAYCRAAAAAAAWHVVAAAAPPATAPALLRGRGEVRGEGGYAGRTWCVTVPSGLLIVRRRGGGGGSPPSAPAVVGNCPGGVDSDFEYSTQAYTGYEPTSMRAIRARYDPWLQTRARVEQLSALGHAVDKVEFIIMGGTFMSLDARYRAAFVASLHDALSGHASGGDAAAAVRFSEQSRARVIGITIETRPDHCGAPHLDDMLAYGCTRVEIGVQSVYEDTAVDTNRGHSVAAVAAAFVGAKDAGFKVVTHMMPDLPRAGWARDLAGLAELFDAPDFRPDGLKLYPTLVIRGTGLYELWRAGAYRNYAPDTLVELTARALALVPPWTRVYRIQRDIPMPLVTAGVEHGNLRELALARMRALGLPCRDVRSREVGIADIHHRVRPDQVELVRRDYVASGGWETFLAYEDPNADILVGLLRLRRPTRAAHRAELAHGRRTSLVRELHVYGTAVPVAARDPAKFQHQGFGTLLMEEAARIARDEHGARRIAVIAGVGTRHYYRKLGYELEGPYMVMDLLPPAAPDAPHAC